VQILHVQRITQPELGHEPRPIVCRQLGKTFHAKNGHKRITGENAHTTKMITDTPKMVGRAYNRRRKMYLCMQSTWTHFFVTGVSGAHA
jgi:hypothetical protein